MTTSGLHRPSGIPASYPSRYSSALPEPGDRCHCCMPAPMRRPCSGRSLQFRQGLSELPAGLPPQGLEAPQRQILAQRFSSAPRTPAGPSSNTGGERCPSSPRSTAPAWSPHQDVRCPSGLRTRWQSGHTTLSSR